MRSRRGPLLALVALLLAPSAAAQTAAPRVEVEAVFPQAPLTPFVDAPGFPSRDEVRAPVAVRVTYTVPANTLVVEPLQVRVERVQTPIWLEIASIVPSFHEVPLERGLVTEDRTFVFDSVVLLTAKASAPALTRGAVEIAAVARASGLMPSARDTAEGLVEARPYVVLGTTSTPNVVEIEPHEEVALEVLAFNAGNAFVAATLEVAHADEGLHVEASEAPVFLRPNPTRFRTDQEARALPVTVRHTGGSGGEVLFLVTPTGEPEGALVQEAAVPLLVTVREPSVGPGVPLLVVLVGALAVLVLRRK